jgi:DNA polymerase III delta prime subunit
MNELWCEKYRPKKIEDCILPSDLKRTFKGFLKGNYVPNLLLSGKSGVGKTTVARALLEECGFDYIIINGSLNGNIDTLRVDIKNFASTVSFIGARKYVILDEADYLNAQSTQPALRNFIEEYSKNCGFIFTCNYKNRIIEHIHSRCSVVEFKIPNSEKAKLAQEFFTRAEYILKEEDIKYDKKALVELTVEHFPDWRRILNELQRYSASGTIDAGVLLNLGDENFKKLVSFLKNKNFKEMRKWVGINNDIEPNVLYRKLYDVSSVAMVEQSIPQLVLHLADYSYKSSFCSDQEINTVACLTEIMADCKFL